MNIQISNQNLVQMMMNTGEKVKIEEYLSALMERVKIETQA
ncbi:hypothetical protein ACF3NR_09900 [Vaginella massiliensis]|nr:hypothetical protein [Vaginella massiliensis]